MIDLTKKYKTRDGRVVTGLTYLPGSGPYVCDGVVPGLDARQEWDLDGRYYNHTTKPDDLDLVLAEDHPTGLITPDPLPLEYGSFVAAVKINFAAGTFATATQEQFDAWLESLTPILRS